MKMTNELIIYHDWAKIMVDEATNAVSAVMTRYYHVLKFVEGLDSALRDVDKKEKSRKINIAMNKFAEFEKKLPSLVKYVAPKDKKKMNKYHRNNFLLWVRQFGIHSEKELLFYWKNLIKYSQKN